MAAHKSITGFFEKFAIKVTQGAGSTAAFIAALTLVVAWAAVGPFFHFSQSWQFVFSTGTTIVTFLMVFLIQKSQNKDSLAIQLKLNELVASNEFASNRMVSVEDMTEDELKIIQKYYSRIGKILKKEDNLLQPHSIDDDTKTHNLKEQMEKELEETMQ